MAQIHEDCLTSTMSNTALAFIQIQFSDIDFDNETIIYDRGDIYQMAQLLLSN